MSELKRLKQLQAVGFMTGSAYFGCDNPNDEDWVIRTQDWGRIIRSELGDIYYEKRQYCGETFRSFVLDYNGVKYNFIVPHLESEYRLMKKATMLMKKIPVKYIQNKATRIEMFEIFKTGIEQSTNRMTEIVFKTTGDDVPF